MSATFMPAERGPVVSHRIWLWCMDGPMLAGRDANEVEFVTSDHDGVCQECKDNGGGFVESVHECEILSVANLNAESLFRCLGIEFVPGECGNGRENAEVFLGRVLLAKCLLPVMAESTQYAGAPDTGYLQEKLSQLHDIASWSMMANTDVVWW